MSQVALKMLYVLAALCIRAYIIMVIAGLLIVDVAKFFCVDVCYKFKIPIWRMVSHFYMDVFI